jgi:protein SCO1/2
MKALGILCGLIVPLFLTAYGQTTAVSHSCEIPDPPGPGLQPARIIEQAPPRSDADALERIKKADQTYSLKQLSEIVSFSADCCTKSDAVTRELTGWLKENHVIYQGKSPTEARQFRGFLMYALGAFVPNEELYGYVKNELQFSSHVFNVASAAHTAKLFTSHAPELGALFKPYLQPSFQDEWVDITTYELHYPPLKPTKARYEILETLQSFDSATVSHAHLPADVIDQEDQKQGHAGPTVPGVSSHSAKTIGTSTPSCCQKEMPVSAIAKNKVEIIPKKDRKEIQVQGLSLLDQDGNAITFENLRGKPFVLTFFYTSCTNPLKCASTVNRLGKLQKALTEKDLNTKVGIYGMTYDADFDSPSVVKSYGEGYGLTFSANSKFLVPVNDSEQPFFKQMDVRVNYGSGSVNQHGVQLFVVDKKGRMSAVYDNDVWEVNEVFQNLVQLAKE